MRRFIFMLWILVLLLACFSVFVGGVILWLRSQDDRANIAARFEPTSSEPRLDTTIFIPPTERDAVQIVRTAIEATDVETIRAHIHETHEVDAEEMLAFLSTMPERHGEVVRYQWVGTVDAEDIQIQSVNVSFEQDHRLKTRNAMLVPDDAGTWRLDFPSFARWCDPPIELLDSEDGYPGGRIRVSVARDFYFNGPFADDREWVCFAFASPDTEARGLAYCRIGSPEHIAMRELLVSRQDTPALATLEVRRVEGAERRQFELTRVVARNWLAVEPSEEDFGE